MSTNNEDQEGDAQKYDEAAVNKDVPLKQIHEEKGCEIFRDILED